MPLKVTWKKGMRLSADIFDAWDISNYESVRFSNLIATGGRFGLVPDARPFELSVNAGNDILEVVSLSCHGVTKSGKIIDIDFDSNYTNTFDTRISIPDAGESESFLLLVRLHESQWREVSDLYSEQVYTFELIGENHPIDRDSLPIGRLVNQYGWRLDETDFVPPCLFTDAHPKFIELVNRATAVLKSIYDRCLGAPGCIARDLLGTLWPQAAESYIDIEKGREGLSPADLFGAVQKVVAAFAVGCSIDAHITLENAAPFISYFQKPYDGRNLYRDIRTGVELCSEISLKMEAVCGMTAQEEPTAPPIEKPRSKPQLPPEPKPAVRNRWEGIEI